MTPLDRIAAWWLRRRGYTVIRSQTVFLGSPVMINGIDSKWVDYEDPRRLRIVAVDDNNQRCGYAVEEPITIERTARDE